jgi:hypothetical protein
MERLGTARLQVTSLSLSLSPVAPTLEHRALFDFSFLIVRQSVGLLWWGISPSQGRYLPQKHRVNANIHALSGIRNHYPSVRAGEDSLCLRPRGHCDRPSYVYETIILPILMFGCETWSLAQREKHRMRVFENRELRGIFPPKLEEVTRGWRKLHNKEYHDLYSSPHIISVSTSGRMR